MNYKKYNNLRQESITNHDQDILVMPESDLDRFWEKVDIKEKNECWNWTKKLDDYGHGRFTYLKHCYMASRVSFVLSKGLESKGEQIYNICGNNACVNPDHLFVKRNNENIYNNPFFLKSFWEKVNRENENECWNWNSCTAVSGYGNFGFLEKNYISHRVSYIIFNGFIPEDICVCHSCDNPLCCNPNHLWLGTRADNNNDKKIKNRAFRPNGSINVKAKLNEEQVRDIRNIHAEGNISELKISKIYNVSENTIQRIIARRAWKLI